MAPAVFLTFSFRRVAIQYITLITRRLLHFYCHRKDIGFKVYPFFPYRDDNSALPKLGCCLSWKLKHK
ncbi:MAG: hypothetical protein DRI26_04485 [Chloroflexi bacterium]|nr:MAG: hypothetical protein DRI26_04485 [Chloroflexota bacterium]